LHSLSPTRELCVETENAGAMPGASDDVTVEIDPQEAFQLFSHELRLEILFALWDAPEYSLAFSEIQSAVGERDSGKFTYHLEKLTDRFITKVDGQYRLQYAGHRAIDAIQSGVFHTSPTVAPREAPGSCAQCETTPTFEYEQHLATVACGECERKLIEYPFDPGGFQDRSITEAIEAFDRRTRAKWRLASSGVCFVCAGRVSVEYTDSAAGIEHNERYEEFFAADHPALFHLSCQNCSFYSYIPVGIRLLDIPSVVGQLSVRGVDLSERYLWEFPFVTDADRIAVRDREPWDVRLEAPTPGGSLEVSLDDAGSVRTISIDP
jgi:DNA-binding transcriptional ArsR family regulator